MPDRGLFGKNFSRFFNYIECYIFRLIFVGFILTLLLYPLAIIVLSLVTGVLIITVWAWMPLVLLITYLFNVIVFQFESSLIPRGFWIRAFPLLTLIISLIISIIKIIFCIVLLILISPIAGFFIVLFAILHRAWRSFTDCVMIIMIKTLGRTPSNNTAIAKKISGPGMSR